MKKLSLIVALCALAATTAHADKLPKFGAEMGKKTILGKEIRMPYTDVVSYYGYIKPGSKPDEEKGGKKYFYIYVWVPAVAPELGVRMISPVPDDMKPEKTDFVSPEFTANTANKTSYFDTWITLERADGITKLEDVATKGKSASWNRYDSNDDSSEMPAQPSGLKYNSLMRISSEPGNPLKALVVGLYRVGFTTYKTGDVQGSFLAQIGAPVKLPGVKVAQDLQSLSKQ